MLASILWNLHPWVIPAQIAIHHRPGQKTRFKGRIPRAKAATISEFFARDLNPDRPVTVFGGSAGGTMQFKAYGLGDRRDGQRVRNFLLEHLR